MKILQVISSINPKGGGPIEGVKQLQVPLQALGVQVEIACCDAPDAPWLATCGLSTVHALGPTRMGYSYAPRLLTWLRENAPRFDAVIVEGLWQYHGLAVRQALAGTKVPYFVFTHGMLDPWFKHTYPLKHFKKWLYWPWAEYRVLRDARAVIFTCEEERLLARQSFWLYRANEAVASYGTSSPPRNGDELAQRFLVANPQLQNKRIALFLSRIHEKKGCDLLLDAFAQIGRQDERLHLVMAGPDQTDWAAILKAQAENLGISRRITWPGMLQGDDKWGAFYAAEVFCLPSHQENFGIVVAEALACGKPVLISNKVNIWREIESDAAGFVDDDTVDGTVHNLQRWLELDTKSYTAMSQRARQCFATHFHIQRAAERVVEIIRECRP
ncbi:glycosyltransferase [Polaromonas naphthalenivorans]|uniref:Glycosyl transferase, group 1 n=1 Tax=Polaromonas naphthalenivorans (strain CJ2) TaxID=365044 RepID=A1VS53_POLNA|nr:glycosyltransferase [Polaromonas naphthalenivorans]ABM38481.1 glycosyl transferase, group 1 [Polaromonas naphthalenivorans CJ2]